MAPSSPSDFLFLKDIVALLELIVIKSMSSTDARSSSYDWMARCLPNESVLAAFSGSCEDQMRRFVSPVFAFSAPSYWRSVSTAVGFMYRRSFILNFLVSFFFQI